MALKITNSLKGLEKKEVPEKEKMLVLKSKLVCLTMLWNTVVKSMEIMQQKFMKEVFETMTIGTIIMLIEETYLLQLIQNKQVILLMIN
jgi:hypothetical protein